MGLKKSLAIVLTAAQLIASTSIMSAYAYAADVTPKADAIERINSRADDLTPIAPIEDN